jgi:hypothetical protein
MMLLIAPHGVALQAMGAKPRMEVALGGGLMVVDMLATWRGTCVCVEVDGPTHFARNLPTHPLGSTVTRNRCGGGGGGGGGTAVGCIGQHCDQVLVCVRVGAYSL